MPVYLLICSFICWLHALHRPICAFRGRLSILNNIQLGVQCRRSHCSNVDLVAHMQWHHRSGDIGLRPKIAVNSTRVSCNQMESLETSRLQQKYGNNDECEREPLRPPVEDRAPSTIILNPNYNSAAFAITLLHAQNPIAPLLQSAFQMHMLQSAKTQ